MNPIFPLTCTCTFSLIHSLDMYTFDVSESAAMETYNELCGAYESIFNKLSLPVTKGKGGAGGWGLKVVSGYFIFNIDTFFIISPFSVSI